MAPVRFQRSFYLKRRDAESAEERRSLWDGSASSASLRFQIARRVATEWLWTSSSCPGNGRSVLPEGEKVAGAVHCDDSTLRVECPLKGRWESKTMLAVEKCGSKDAQRKQGSEIFRPPFFDRLFLFCRRCQQEHDPSSTPAKFFKRRGTEVAEGRRSL